MSDQYSPPLAEDEKKVVHSDGPDIEGAAPSGRARWLGGSNVSVGPRIGPVLSSLSNSYNSDTDDSSSAILHKQKEAEANATIKYRTCSWQKVCATPTPFRVALPSLGFFCRRASVLAQLARSKSRSWTGADLMRHRLRHCFFPNTFVW